MVYSGINSNFVYLTASNTAEDGSTFDEKYRVSIKRALKSFSDINPVTNKGYPTMIVISGSTGATFAGVINVTNTAMRFLLAYNSSLYSGTYVRASDTMSAICAFQSVS